LCGACGDRRRQPRARPSAELAKVPARARVGRGPNRPSPSGCEKEALEGAGRAHAAPLPPIGRGRVGLENLKAGVRPMGLTPAVQARLTRRRTDAARPREAWPSRTEENNRRPSKERAGFARVRSPRSGVPRPRLTPKGSGAPATMRAPMRGRRSIFVLCALAFLAFGSAAGGSVRDDTDALQAKLDAGGAIF